jgi:hypothetical protein
MNLRDDILRRLLVVSAAVLAVLTVVGCGGGGNDAGGEGDTDVSPPPAGTIAPAEGPGTITLTSSAIRGQAGKVLLVFAMPAGGGERIARACTQIASDDFTLGGAVMTEMPAGENPCAEGTSEVTLTEGTYTLIAGVYVGGQQTPEAETTLAVTVAGDVTAELNGDELSR